MSSFLFSIIIPYKNNYNTLNQCIRSVLNQKIQEIEIILIDDGSTDKSIDIIKKYKKYKNIRLIKNNKSKGVSFSRNKGIKKATGKYCVFLDSDDALGENLLKIVKRQVLKNNYDYLYINSKNLDTQKIDNQYILYKKANFFLKNVSNHKKFKLHCWNYIIKKEIVLKNLFINTSKIYEDQLFVTNLIFNYKKYFIIKNAYYLRRISNLNSLGRSIGTFVLLNSMKNLEIMNKKFDENNIMNKKFIDIRMIFFLNEILKNLFFTNLKNKKKFIDKILYKIKINNKIKLKFKKKLLQIDNFLKNLKNDKNKVATIYCFGQLGKIIYEMIKKNYSSIYLIDNNVQFNKRKFDNKEIINEKKFFKKRISKSLSLFIAHDNKEIIKEISKKFTTRYSKCRVNVFNVTI